VNSKRFYVSSILAVVVILAAGLAARSTASLTMAQGARPQAPVGTPFTYQGRLTDAGGNPVNDACDLQFSLWDDPDTGSQVDSTQEKTGVAVGDGLLTVQLDFGSVFDGTALWLEVAVRCTGDPGYVTLPQRQPLTPAPYALRMRPTSLPASWPPIASRPMPTWWPKGT
jgi:hypothetical protein